MPGGARAAPASRSLGRRAWLAAYSLALAVAALGLAAATPTPAEVLGRAGWWQTGSLLAVLVAAGWLQLEVWYGTEGESFDLSEAALAPVLFLLPPLGAVAQVAVAQSAAEALLRRHPLKACFNVCQWALATAAGSLAFTLLRPDGPPTQAGLPALLAGLLAVSVVNHAALVGVFWLDQRGPLRRVLTAAAPGALVGWLVVAVNLAFGVLFVAVAVWVPAATL